MIEYKTTQSWEFLVQTSDPATGAARDADALPSWRLYQASTDAVIATGTCAKRDDANTTGLYTATASCAALILGADYYVVASATVDGTAGSETVGEFRITAAGNVISGSTTSFTTGMRARGIGTDLLDDTAAAEVIGEALYEFSRYRPIVATGTFETVEDQQEYDITDLDADALTAMLVLWNPSGSLDDWYDTLVSLGVPVGDFWLNSAYYHMPSMAVIDQIKRSALAKNYGGTGRQIDPDGGAILLDPVPGEAGETVFVIYTKRLSTTNQVKAGDRDIFLDLLCSMCSDRIALEKEDGLDGMDVQTPEYRIASKSLDRWRNRSETWRNRFVSKTQAGSAAAGRT